MTSLFTENEGYTAEADTISQAFSKYADEILHEYGDKYSTIEVEKIMSDVVFSRCISYRTGKNLKKLNDVLNT